jgi:hypothetical protein
MQLCPWVQGDGQALAQGWSKMSAVPAAGRPYNKITLPMVRCCHPLSASPCTLQAAAYLAIKNEADAGGQGEQQQQLAVQGQQAPAGSGYLCPSCVHSAGDACPLDMLQLHAAVLADIKPRRPRSAADIHAAELTRKVRPAACGVASGGAAGVPRFSRLRRAFGGPNGSEGCACPAC